MLALTMMPLDAENTRKRQFGSGGRADAILFENFESAHPRQSAPTQRRAMVEPRMTSRTGR